MSSKTVLETLEAARKLITPRKAWIKNHLARTSPRGKRVDPEHPSAKCFCSSGAILHVNPDFTCWTALNRVMGFSIPEFNDTHTHAEVLRAFDEAIAVEKAKVTA